jgi:hypothetical protein
VVIVAIAIESEIPIKLSPQLDVVRRVQIEVYSAGLRNGRKEIGEGFHFVIRLVRVTMAETRRKDTRTP